MIKQLSAYKEDLVNYQVPVPPSLLPCLISLPLLSPCAAKRMNPSEEDQTGRGGP
jgi:hypothetical protein